MSLRVDDVILSQQTSQRWRGSLNRKPSDAQEEPVRYAALVDRVAKLIAARKIDVAMADVIVGRREPSAPELAWLIQVFATVESEGLADTAYGLVGGGDYALWNAEMVADVFERSDMSLI